ncbi:putative membrane protein [Alkalibacterium sp. AK22]|uniref:ABC transporter permease n=1 Tax=Alkalibacterium sp. AK22 TaxID=1229520 RepID=UPI00044DD485|nr:ABC transporter permease subunit [Alkalibacterium sp. AK22]EXJ23031.1 putative membrane protein [Alkalibacterium sp. AK22]
MMRYAAFIRKELKEQLRNYKFFITGIVFAFIGLLSPLSARFLPELLENLVDDNVTIILAEPTHIDSWMQFFSNINQIGLVVFVLLFSPVLAKEYSQGTLVHMVTKGLPRTTIYMAKLTVLLLTWTAAYWFSYTVTLGYTLLYFPEGPLDGLILPAVSLYTFGLMLASVLMGAAVLFKSSYAPLLAVAGLVGLLFIGNLFPLFQEWSPLQLATRNVEILILAEGDASLVRAFILASLLILVVSLSGAALFKRKPLQ